MKSKYVCNPNVTYQVRKDEVLFYNHFYNDLIRSDVEKIKLFEFFRIPQAICDLHLNDEERSFLDTFLKRFFIIDQKEVDLLSRGLLNKNNTAIGDYCKFWDIPSSKDNQSIYAVFGVPFDLGSRSGGARLGSSIIREAFQKYSYHLKQAKSSSKKIMYDFDFRRKYKLTEWNLYDIGDIQYDLNQSVDVLSLKTQKVTRALLEKKITPIILGGDHTITYYVLQGMNSSYKDFGVIQIDAHHDLYLNTFRQRNTLNHGNFIFHALKLPNLKHVHCLGLRTFEYLSGFAEKNRSERITYVSSQEIKRKGVSEILKSIKPNLPYHLTIDLDVLSPISKLEVGTPVVGGLEYYDLAEIVQVLTDNVQIVSIDFVEVSPSTQMGNYAAEVASRLLTLFLLQKQPSDIIK